MKYRFLLAFILLSATAFAADDTAAKIDKVLNAYHDAGLLNGVVLVADHGKVIYKKGFGYANFEWQVPNMPDTKFRIGSVTKPFTAILTLQQVEAGRLRLDAPIAEYLPDYRKDTATKVTVRHLLTHTSGIPTYKAEQILAAKSPVPYPQLVKEWCSGELRWKPGTRWDYNNCGYLLLGVILEKVTGKPYSQLLRENILLPAGMNDSGIDSSQLILPKRAYGYENGYVKGFQAAEYTEISTALGAGDIYSTAEDLYRFDRALYSDKLLKHETRELMFTPQNERTGLGWFVRKAPQDHPAAGDTLQWHEGHMFGFFTMYTRIPEREALVVTIDNTDMDSFDEIRREIFRILYKGAYELPKKPIGMEVARVLRDSGAKAAIARFQELKKNAASEYDFGNWRSLNSVGYAFLHAARPKDAIALFKLNAENFDRWETWDSLAEAYMADKQNDLAIRYYENRCR